MMVSHWSSEVTKRLMPGALAVTKEKTSDDRGPGTRGQGVCRKGKNVTPCNRANHFSKHMRGKRLCYSVRRV